MMGYLALLNQILLYQWLQWDKSQKSNTVFFYEILIQRILKESKNAFYQFWKIKILPVCFPSLRHYYY